MKKTYVAPDVIELIALEAADVITLSSTQEDPFVEDW